jgi:hypothetical protein
MPLIPIAESKPPIVVGIRHTKSAINTGTLSSDVVSPDAVSEYEAKPLSVTTASKNTIESAARTILSAISFGAYDGCRVARDGGFVHAGNAFDDFAVARNHIARFADDHIATLEFGRNDSVFGGRRIMSE